MVELALAMAIGLNELNEKPITTLPDAEFCINRYRMLEKKAYELNGRTKYLLPEYKRHEIEIVANSMYFSSWVWWVAYKMQTRQYKHSLDHYDGIERAALDYILSGSPLP